MEQELDVLVIGGGVAALWLLAQLRARGHAAAMLAEGPLGGTQSLASQGIIHGGLKYAFGAPARGATPLQAMPGRWREALRGACAPDLREARLLCPSILLWHDGSAGARTRARLARALLAAPVRTLEQAGCQAPAPACWPSRQAWVVEEPVLDVPSVVRALHAAHAAAIVAIDWQRARFLRGTGGRVTGVACGEGALRARLTVLCAGEGNEALLALLGARAPRMQRRPLQQVLLYAPELPPLYGHCIGARGRVRLTVTSHALADGRRAWYLGGALAENGAALPAAALLDVARRELAAVFPALELDRAAWRTLRVVRAEPAARGLRPQDAYLGTPRNAPGAAVAWPTKLALVPRLAERVAALAGLPAARVDAARALHGLPRSTTFARAPWEEWCP